MAAPEMKRTLRPCPICGEASAAILHRQSFVLPEGSPLPARYDVVSCHRCAFVYADTPGCQADYDRHYERFSKYEDPSVATGGGESELDRRRLDETAATVAYYLEPLGKEARVLDIGCANGGLLAALRRLGYSQLHGLDPSPGCVAHLREAGFEGTCGKLCDIRALSAMAPFDAIVLSHVLEHVVATDAAMRALVPLLKPKGIVYVEVPDAARYADYPFVPFYYFDSEHINHFDATSLVNLATAHRFRTVASATRDIVVAGGRTYPAVWSVMTAGPDSGVILPASGLPERISTYVEQSRKASAYPALMRLAADGRPLVLWGAGSYAQRLLDQSPLARCDIAGVVDQDRNKHGLSFAGCTVCSPESLVGDAFADIPIVVACVLHAQDIEQRIRALGLNNPVVVPDGSMEGC